ncbi:MAG: hypothetical protein KY468_20350, partial [Armatimonadetes bacterium]|nr:hypothetical protein [Armatimonadota bacterium]
MPADLAQHIRQTPLCDTHEHLRPDREWIEAGPDILADLFGNYLAADLRTAGAGDAAMDRLMDTKDPDIPARFEGIRPAWDAALELFGPDRL